MLYCTNSNRPKKFWKEVAVKVSEGSREAAPNSFTIFFHENLPYEIFFWQSLSYFVFWNTRIEILFQVFLVFRVQDFRRTLLLLSLVCMIIPLICFHVCFLFYEIKILNNKLKLDASWRLEFSVAVNHPGEIALSGICLG